MYFGNVARQCKTIFLYVNIILLVAPFYLDNILGSMHEVNSNDDDKANLVVLQRLMQRIKYKHSSVARSMDALGPK